MNSHFHLEASELPLVTDYLLVTTHDLIVSPKSLTNHKVSQFLWLFTSFANLQNIFSPRLLKYSWAFLKDKPKYGVTRHIDLVCHWFIYVEMVDILPKTTGHWWQSVVFQDRFHSTSYTARSHCYKSAYRYTTVMQDCVTMGLAGLCEPE